MIPDLSQLLAAPPWLLDLLDTSVRVSVLLVAAAITVSLLRRAPAQARHQVWTLALAGALVLPALALVLPAWHLRILPAAAPPPALELQPPAGLERLPRAYAYEVASGQDAVVVAIPRALRLPRAELAAAPRPRPPLVARLVGDVLAPLAPAPGQSPLPLSLDRWLLALWLSGIALVLGKVVLDRVQVWYLAQRARAVRDERADLFQAQQRRLGLANVALVELEDVELPMAWGVLRPTVALPASSRRWSTGRLEAVMLHELAHVRRRDALTQLIASLACALYWFHPLTWLAARQMRVLREYACDDEVLSQGVRPSSYAEDIIGIVQALRRDERESSATLAMARRSQLGARLLALLDPRVPHVRLGRAPATALSLGAMALLVSAAVVRPAAAETPPPATLPRLTPGEAAQRQGQLPAAAATAPAAAQEPTPAPAPAPTPAPAPRARRGTPATPATPAAPAAPVAAPSPAAPAPTPAPAPAAAPAAPAPIADGDEDGEDWDVNDWGGAEPDGAGGWNVHVNVPDVRVRVGHARSDEEELGRLEAMRRESGGDERALTRSLLKLAHDADFETETSRQAYLAATASLRSDELRLDALKALLKGAPISVETGRGVLAQAQRFQADDQRAELLAYMHRIRESDLVRGPLAGVYLDVAEQLRSQEALARSLRDLLHPREVPPEMVLRALGLLQRVTGASWRKEVLVEVTDHQRITPPVEAAYLDLLRGLEGSALKDAQERLADAKATRRHRGWSFSFGGSRGSDGSDTRDPARVAELDRARAEAQRARAEAQRELAREREALRRGQQQLEENARQLRQQAKQLARQYQERAKQLKERLKRQFGEDSADLDADVQAE